MLLAEAACCLLLPAAGAATGGCSCCCCCGAAVVLLWCCCNQTASKARNKQPDTLFETHPKEQKRSNGTPKKGLTSLLKPYYKIETLPLLLLPAAACCCLLLPAAACCWMGKHHGSEGRRNPKIAPHKCLTKTHRK